MLFTRLNYGVLLAITILIIITFTTLSKTTYSPQNITLSSLKGSLTPSKPSKNLSPPSPTSHVILKSLTSHDGTYWPIDFLGTPTMNPNTIPHPSLPNTWLVIAARADEGFFCVEIHCSAQFHPSTSTLRCLSTPEILPIAATSTSKCHGTNTGYELLEMNIGPHDGRVFYGPHVPYTIYGSNSGFTCFGQWMQDLRALVAWPDHNWVFEEAGGERWLPKELQRPKWGLIEKNWFLFWDAAGVVYVHYDVAPTRSFAKIELGDGSVGEDLAPLSRVEDEKCWNALAPKPVQTLDMKQSVHQATNSLAIVLCRSDDVTCKPEENTYIMHIFQHKYWAAFHGMYEPHVMLFHNKPPFALYGVTTTPMWIHGRGGPGEGKRKVQEYETNFGREWDQTEMLYVTSMNWREFGRNYTGWLDDVVMLGFGLEDEASGLMDIMGADLVKGLKLCAEVL